MEDKDIIGKEFICCEFDKTPMIRFDNTYKELIGCESIVLNIHQAHPEYTQVHVTKKNGTKTKIHFPTDVVKEQIKEMESRPAGYYFNEVRKILAKI